MCLTWDVSFSRIPAKGWQAQKGRGWHRSLPLSALHGIPHQTPVLDVTQIPQLGPAGPIAFFFFFSFSFLCFLISSSQVLLSHYRNAPKSCAKTCLPSFSMAQAQLSVDRWARHLGNSQLPVPDGVSLVQEKAHNWVAGTDALQTVSGSVFLILPVPYLVSLHMQR